MSPIVLTISPSFPICFPSFRSHSHRLHRCYETLIRQAIDAPICFLLRRPSRRQNRCSYKHAFPTNMITCIHHCNPHMTHHMQSSRDSRLSRFTKCLSPSLSHPLSLYVRSFHTLHSHAAQLHSLHSRLRLKHSP